MAPLNASITLLAGLCCAACSPALDWREFVPEGSGVHVSFPCRPDRQARSVVVAGMPVRMEMLACHAGDATFALAFVDVAEPARVGAALAELRATAVGNLGAAAAAPLVRLQIAGMTPNPESGRLTIEGKLPDGAAVREHAAWFSRGLRIYQATVIGAKPAPQAVETFFAALRLAG